MLVLKKKLVLAKKEACFYCSWELFSLPCMSCQIAWFWSASCQSSHPSFFNELITIPSIWTMPVCKNDIFKIYEMCVLEWSLLWWRNFQLFWWLRMYRKLKRGYEIAWAGNTLQLIYKWSLLLCQQQCVHLPMGLWPNSWFWPLLLVQQWSGVLWRIPLLARYSASWRGKYQLRINGRVGIYINVKYCYENCMCVGEGIRWSANHKKKAVERKKARFHCRLSWLVIAKRTKVHVSCGDAQVNRGGHALCYCRNWATPN